MMCFEILDQSSIFTSYDWTTLWYKYYQNINNTNNFCYTYLGHIVAIASNCALFGLSHLGDYCASKFAIIGIYTIK